MDDRVGVTVKFYKDRPPRPIEISIKGMVREVKNEKCIHRLYRLDLDDGTEIEVIHDIEAATWQIQE